MAYVAALVGRLKECLSLLMRFCHHSSVPPSTPQGANEAGKEVDRNGATRGPPQSPGLLNQLGRERKKISERRAPSAAFSTPESHGREFAIRANC